MYRYVVVTNEVVKRACGFVSVLCNINDSEALLTSYVHYLLDFTTYLQHKNKKYKLKNLC